MISLDVISQAAILMTCMSSIMLVNDPRPRVQRFACIFGLISEPFWYYTTITHHQWGLFAASIVYTFAWGRGFFNNWLK